MSSAPRPCCRSADGSRPCRSGMKLPCPGGPTPVSTRTFAPSRLARNTRMGISTGPSSSRSNPSRNVTKLPNVSSIACRSVILERERPAAGEAVLGRVPVLDLVLPQSPAEQNGLTAAKRGEVDETLVGVLHLDAARRDLIHDLRQRPRLTFDIVRRLGKGCRRDAAAVTANPALELLLACKRLEMSGAESDHLLDERPNLGQGRVRLLGSEVAHACNPMRA